MAFVSECSWISRKQQPCVVELSVTMYEKVINPSEVSVIREHINHKVAILPIPVAAQSKVWVFDRSLAGIAGSNPAWRMDAPLVTIVCCQAQVSATGRSPVQRSRTACVCVCVCYSVINCNNKLLHLPCVGRKSSEWERKKERKEKKSCYTEPP